MVPFAQREQHLHHRLSEMNRRLRRRMISRGEITLDVDDSATSKDGTGGDAYRHGRSEHEQWPHIQDLSVDSLQYSVHFPLVPQAGVWPDGVNPIATAPAAAGGSSLQAHHVGRVLNIVVPESRLLSSRERCPYLVHVEIADSGLEGNDARLYAMAGATDLGSTMTEALGMGGVLETSLDQGSGTAVQSYTIPPELSRYSSTTVSSSHLSQLTVSVDSNEDSSDTWTSQTETSMSSTTMSRLPAPAFLPRGPLLPRGGWQSDGVPYYEEESFEFVNRTPFDIMRQSQIEELHHEMQAQASASAIPHPPQYMMDPRDR
jgi:hypothetical protein